MLIAVFPMNYFGTQHVGKSCILQTRKEGTEKSKLREISRLPWAASQFFFLFYFNPQPNEVRDEGEAHLTNEGNSEGGGGSVTYPGSYSWRWGLTQVF